MIQKRKIERCTISGGVFNMRHFLLMQPHIIRIIEDKAGEN